MKKIINDSFKLVLLFISIWGVVSCDDTDSGSVAPPPSSGSGQVAFWLTNPDKTVLFKKQSTSLNFKEASNSYPTIEIDTTQTYQSIDGFGFTLTGGSAYVISRMSTTARAELLNDLFAFDSTYIGISYLRLNLGASDLSANVYSYDDLPSGQTDPTLANFSLAPDQTYYLPVLKEILAINPDVKLLATPWSPPTWMKTNNSSVGGSLKPEYYDAYAQYLVKYIQAMKAESITIDAITLQNEPLNGNNNPSMEMSATEQANFIKNNIGPALQAAGLTTKIIIYDHNLDQPDYPISILNDAQAKPYIDGSAFHLYAGSIGNLLQVRNAHPDKNLYFTEQYTATTGDFAGDLNWHVENLIVGATRNYSRNVLEWNLVADAANGPYTNGGCSTCLPGVTVGATTPVRNVAYYIIAHASKFVRPGSVRIASNITNNLQNVAFKRADGKKVLIVLNDNTSAQNFNISYRGKVVTSVLNGGAVGTYVW